MDCKGKKHSKDRQDGNSDNGAGESGSRAA